MVILCIVSNSIWISGFMQYFLAPFIVAAISYYCFGQIDEFKKRKNYSLLGVELISTFIEEIETGKNILSDKSNINKHTLPSMSWSGINTIQDEIILRIIAVSENTKDVGFPARHIRSHLKNYFEYIIPNWEKTHSSNLSEADIEKYRKYYESKVTKVFDMLVNIRNLLQQNANRIFPK